MSDNICVFNVTTSVSQEEEMCTPTDLPTAEGASNIGTASEATGKIDKSIQIDMDCEPGDDPKKNQKYWQHLAGLRGAREQYLQEDIRDLSGKYYMQIDCIHYLKLKLNMANKELAQLKAKRCRCQKKDDRPVYKPVSSIGL